MKQYFNQLFLKVDVQNLLLRALFRFIIKQVNHQLGKLFSIRDLNHKLTFHKHVHDTSILYQKIN